VCEGNPSLIMDKVAIIIPSWNGKRHLQRCLPAVLAQTFPHFEVVVVDNASTDGSVEWVQEHFPQITLIVNDSNLGFAEANNIAIRTTSAPYVATLNNDTQVETTWLSELVNSMTSDSRVGMVASKILYMQPPHLVDSAGIGVSRAGLAQNRYNGMQENSAETEPYEVFGPSAAAALYRRAMLDEIGLFDETFFAYHEDTDLAWRARLMGWRCLYVPTARVYHAHSATGRQGSPFKRYLLARNGLWTVIKNYPSPDLWLYLPEIVFYNLLSIIYRLILERSWSPVRGSLAALRQVRQALRQRRLIQKQRCVSSRDMRKLMSPSSQLLRITWRRLKAPRK
jgi:GT2 family glycosyltransferase